MTDNAFHTLTNYLITAFDAGEITYEEFDEGYEALLEELNDEDV